MQCRKWTVVHKYVKRLSVAASESIRWCVAFCYPKGNGTTEDAHRQSTYKLSNGNSIPFGGMNAGSNPAL